MNNFLIVLAGLVFILIFLYYVPLGLYFICKTNTVDLSLLQLMLMRFRKVPPAVIVNSVVKARNKGIVLDVNMLEAYYLSYGNVYNLTEAIIYARQKEVNISQEDLMQAGLQQKDLINFIDTFNENK